MKHTDKIIFIMFLVATLGWVAYLRWGVRLETKWELK